MGAPRTGAIVGRDTELAGLEALLAPDRTRAFVLSGEPGIGKTTLWEAAVELARGRGLRVLAARATGAETRLAFAALIDLLDGVDAELSALPAPQRHALEVALLRAEPDVAAPEAQAIALGVLNVLRALAAETPLLVAVDDLQWLDGASAGALAYAARRLGDERVAFLLARRPGTPSDVERALEATLEHVDLRPPSLDASRHILSERLGLTMPRHALRRLYDATLGNPLFVLEVGRTVREHGLPAIGDDLPVPHGVEELLGTRVAALPDAPRRVLLAAALSPTLRVGQLASIAEPDAVDAAVAAGVVLVDGDRLRASHPLVAAAALATATAAERRELHGDLAGVLPPGELRTRHLALAAARPDAALAADVAAAASRASSRGAPQAAVELAEHALRLTPADDADRDERVLELAQYLVVAGEKRRVTELLEPHVDALAPGARRARAYLLLTNGEIRGNEDIRRWLELALAESGADPHSRAAVLAEMAENVAAVRVERIAEAERWAVEALEAAAGAGPALERRVLYALAWTRSLGGQPVDDVAERFRAAAPEPSYLASSPERVAGQRLVWRGELARAREVLTRQLEEADERGEPSSYALGRLHVCELELRAGGWDAAERLLDEWAQTSDRELLHWPMYERCRALLAAGRGARDEALRWGAEAHARARESGVRWDELEALRALGLAELLAHDAGRARQWLAAVWEHTEREGVCDPGAFPVAPELVEALVELGELEWAGVVADRVAALAAGQDHPWARVTAERCAALARLALVRDDAAAAGLADAADAYARLGLRFDAARTLLALGRTQRRLRKWGAARDALERAVSAFEELGSHGWAADARSELERVGARRPAQAGELTAAERRVAELAADGLANKEIAQALVVSVSTVEFHLSNAYGKLGIRSRAQLAARLAASAEPPR